MEYREDRMIHFKLFGNGVIEKLQAICKTGCANDWRLQWKYFIQLSNGEAVFYNNDRYASSFASDRERHQYKNLIANRLNKAAKYIAFTVFNEKLSSPAQLRKSKHANDTITLKYEGDTVSSTTSVKTSLSEIAFLIEYFWEAKDIKNIKKNYSKEVISSIIGDAADPFTTSTIEVLTDQIAELQKKEAEAFDELRRKQNEEATALKKLWADRIKEVEQQIQQIRTSSTSE